VRVCGTDEVTVDLAIPAVAWLRQSTEGVRQGLGMSPGWEAAEFGAGRLHVPMLSAVL
jgi:hypothetical protein